MTAVLLSGGAHPGLAEAIGAALGVAAAPRIVERFPDGEPHVSIDAALGGADVYVVQPLSPPADVHLVELLLLADACRRGGAARVTLVVPYLAFARQDRRRSDAEPHGARLAADLLSSRAARVIALDVHGSAAEGFFSVPFEPLTAIPLLADALGAPPADAVVVSPDLGGARRAEAFAAHLGLPAATVHKSRVSAREVRAVGVVGDVAGRAPILVDDMITTGGTIEAAVRALLDAGCRPEIRVVATHALLVGDAAARLGRLGLARVVVTDAVPVPPAPGVSLEVVSVAPLLAEAIRRLSSGRPLRELLAT